MDNNPAIEINRYLGGGDLTLLQPDPLRRRRGLRHRARRRRSPSTSGVADTVVCYRAMNERSMQRFGAGVQDRPPTPTAENAHFGWYSPYGLLTPA